MTQKCFKVNDKTKISYVKLDRHIKNSASFDITDNNFIYFDLCTIVPGRYSASGKFNYYNNYAVCCTQLIGI